MSGADEANARAKARRALTCRHFNGLQNCACKAGIQYATVRDESVRPFRFPCLNIDAATTCQLRATYTAAELEEQERNQRQSITRVFAARKAIVEVTGGKSGCAGVIDCPNCGGKLKYSVSSNGHIWSVCSTKDCAQWME